jgi:nucleoside-diphosphate-sugar epimerase
MVYTSGIWALGPYRGVPDDETTPAERPASKSAYRVDLERAILAAGGGALRTAVVRPGMVYGGKEGVAGWMLDWLPAESGRPDKVVVLGDGANRWPVVHRDDLADLYLRIGAHVSAAGVFHAVEPEPVGVRRIADELGRLAGRAVVSWDVGEATAKLGAIVEAAIRDQHVVAPRAQAVVGWRPTRAPLADAVPALYREWLG